MTKNTIFAFLILIFLVSLSTVSATNSDTPQWSQDANNNQNTGQSPYLGPQNNTTKFNHTFSENESIGFKQGSGPVVGHDGTIYVGTNDETKEYGILNALKPDGTLKWTHNLVNDYITATPTIGPDGTIYVPTGSAQDGVGRLYALLDGGNVAIYKWNYTLESDTEISGSAIVSPNGTIYFGANSGDEGSEGYIYALNPNGSLKWEYVVDDMPNMRVINTPALGSDGTIYFNWEGYAFMGSEVGLYAINDMNTHARQKWIKGLTTPPMYNELIGSPVVGSDGTIYVSHNFGGFGPTFSWFNMGNIVALTDDATSANIKWTYELDGMDCWVDTQIAIAKDGTIYFGGYENDQNNLFAIKYNGTDINKEWNYAVDYVILYPPIIGSDGTIYFGDGGRFTTFFALNPNGTLKWSYNATPITTTAMAQDGTIYFGTGDFGSVGEPNIAKSNNKQSAFSLIAIKGPPSDLYIKTSVDNPNPNIGEIVTILFKVGNDGPNTAYNTILKYVIPEGMKFIKAWADVGAISYDPKTRTVTWDMGNVPVGDPKGYVQVMAQKSGKFPVIPEITTTTDNPNLSQRIGVSSITVNAATNNNTNNTNNNNNDNNQDNEDTVPMQPTGIPFAPLLLASILVIGGSIIPLRKNKDKKL